MTTKRLPWTQDEIRVLSAIYFRASFSKGDDAQDECRLIADCFGRTPASIDRQWRNLAAVVKGNEKMHVGRIVVEAANEFLNDPVACARLARTIMERNSWPLQRLLETGQAVNALSEATDVAFVDEFREHVIATLTGVDYRIFPSGSHGYALNSEFTLAGTRCFGIDVSCALLGSNQLPVVHMAASKGSIVDMLRALVHGAGVRQLPTGRVAMYVSHSAVLSGQRFSVSIQVIEMKG